jgi:hypothetical protein
VLNALDQHDRSRVPLLRADVASVAANTAFGGDKSLKVMQQMIAASQAGRDLVYHAFGTTYRGRLLAEWIDELQGLVAARQLTVGTVSSPVKPMLASSQSPATDSPFSHASRRALPRHHRSYARHQPLSSCTHSLRRPIEVPQPRRGATGHAGSSKTPDLKVLGSIPMPGTNLPTTHQKGGGCGCWTYFTLYRMS